MVSFCERGKENMKNRNLNALNQENHEKFFVVRLDISYFDLTYVNMQCYELGVKLS